MMRRDGAVVNDSLTDDERTSVRTAGEGRTYSLLGADRHPYDSVSPGALGGHRGSHIFGRLDCPSALRAIANGGYVKNRVFFADEATATAAGFRPCGVCLPEEHAAWKAAEAGRATATSATDSAPGERYVPREGSTR